MSVPLRDRFAGSLLGGLVGDMIGAAVEGESPGYIRKTFRGVDDILRLEHVEEVFGGKWIVGRFTDDTQMSLCVAEWLLEDDPSDGKSLLTRFSRTYQSWRRYGPGAGRILEAFPQYEANWTALATMMFPQGSYGNGSAMRAGPIGLYFHKDLRALVAVARTSSVTTHSHPLAVQGAALQAAAVAKAVVSPEPLRHEEFLDALTLVLKTFEASGQDTLVYRKALATIADGLQAGFRPAKLDHLLGTGIKAQEAVPMAIYCFLANPKSYEQAVGEAVFLGGDTDTIASMTGSIAGAYLGSSQIPERWLTRVREEHYNTARIRQLADALYRKVKETEFGLYPKLIVD